MNEIPQIILQTVTGILSVIGGLCCIYYILCRNQNDLYIKGNAYLILDVDAIGDKLEYYVRRIQNDINNRYIYISRIVLYSKSSESLNLSQLSELSSGNDTTATDVETLNICRILTQDYNNIVFLGDCDDYEKNDILSIFADVTE